MTLTEDDYASIVEEAAASLRQAAKGVQGQVVRPADSLEWHVMQVTWQRARSGMDAAPGPAVPNSLEAAIQTQENWDGYHGEPTTPEAIAKARYYAWFPLSDGGLLFDGGDDPSLTIRPDGSVEPDDDAVPAEVRDALRPFSVMAHFLDNVTESTHGDFVVREEEGVFRITRDDLRRAAQVFARLDAEAPTPAAEEGGEGE